MTEENVNVLYFHGTTCDDYRFTISGVVEGDDLIMGISICSGDEPFCKSKGRTISSGRLFNQRSIRGRIRRSLYAHDLVNEYKNEIGFPENYWVGNEVKVFRSMAPNYQYFTKKELQQEFHLYHRTPSKKLALVV